MSRSTRLGLAIVAAQLCAAMLTVPAGGAFAYCDDDNLVAIVLEDGGYNQTINDYEIHHAIVYLLNPTAPSGCLSGWEFSVVLPSQIQVTAWRPVGGGINQLTPPDFQIHVGTALPYCAEGAAVPLLEIDFVLNSQASADLRVEPLAGGTISGCAGYRDGDDSELTFCMAPVSGDWMQPLARINGAPLAWCEPPVAPPPPTGLAAVALDGTSVALSWMDRSVNEDGFSIYRGFAPTGLDSVDVVGPGITEYLDTDLSPTTTYYYRVYAYNDMGRSDGYSTDVVVTSQALPAGPSDFQGEAVWGTQARITWLDNSNNEEGFRVYRGTSPGSLEPVGQVQPNAEVYFDATLEPTTTYHYRVYAYNEIGESADYAGGSVTTPELGLACDEPDLVGMLFENGAHNLDLEPWTTHTATVVVLNPSIAGACLDVWALVLDWTSNVTVLDYRYLGDGYNSEAPPSFFVGSFSPLCEDDGTVALLEVDFQVTDSSPAEFFVRPFSDPYLPDCPVYYRNDDPTNQYCLTPVSADYDLPVARVNGETLAYCEPATPPIGPSELVAMAVGNDTIDLVWDDNSADEDGFHIYSGPNDNTLALIATVGPDVEYFRHGGLQPGTTRCYRVYAFRGSLESISFGSDCATTTDDLPVGPANLQIQVLSQSSVLLTWEDIGNNTDGFNIYRTTTGDSAFYQVGGNVTSFTDAGLMSGVTYRYRVCAFNEAGVSQTCAVEEVTIEGGPPASPSDLSCRALGMHSARLTWHDNAGNEQFYYVYRGTSYYGVSRIAMLAANTVTMRDDGLVPGQTYYYRVYAFNSLGCSEDFATCMLEIPEDATPVAEDPDGGTPGRTTLLAPHPNPFNPRTEITFWLQRSERSLLTVHDAQGRQVASLARGISPAGWNAIVWEGKDQRGRALPSGVYFLKLAVGDIHQIRKVVLLR